MALPAATSIDSPSCQQGAQQSKVRVHRNVIDALQSEHVRLARNCDPYRVNESPAIETG